MTGPDEENAFTVRTERQGSVVRLCVSGELDLQREPDLLRALMAALEDRPVDLLVLDVTGLRFLDSSGLRALLACRDRTLEAGATFRLVVAPGPVTRLLDVAGVRGWFDYA